MSVSSVTILGKNELDKKHQLEQSVIDGIELGKRGFQQAAQALLEIDQLALWRDEATDFNTYRQKFKAVLEDLNISPSYLNRLIAAEKCVQMLTPIGVNISQYKESHIRPLTQLKEPKQIQQAYKRALDLAENEGCELKAEYVQKAVEEIKPPKVRLPKPPRIPIGATVRILPHYADEEFHGAEGVITQHPNHDRCVVRFDDQTSKLIPDNMLVCVEEIREMISTKQEAKAQARALGLRTGLDAIPEPKEILNEQQQLDIEIAVAAFLRILPRLSQWQKGVIYEQLLKSGFVPGKVAA